MEGKGYLECVIGTQKEACLGVRGRLSLLVKPNHHLKLSTGAILQEELKSLSGNPHT